MLTSNKIFSWIILPAITGLAWHLTTGSGDPAPTTQIVSSDAAYDRAAVVGPWGSRINVAKDYCGFYQQQLDTYVAQFPPRITEQQAEEIGRTVSSVVSEARKNGCAV